MNKTKEIIVLPTLDAVAPEHRIHKEEYLRHFEDEFVNGVQLNKADLGYTLPPGFMPETGRYGYNQFEFNSDDILVATFPKTGTTWMSSIIQHILYGRQPELLEKAKAVTFFYSYLEFGPVSKYRVVENLPLPRKIMGTHLPEPLVNMKKLKEQGVKVIYVMRNPKDRAVSWYKFNESLPWMKHEELLSHFPRDEKQFYDVSFSGKQGAFTKDGEDYLEQLKLWYKHKGDENVKFMMYEKMKKNPHAEINEVAKFLGVDLSEKELDDVVQKTSFSRMKEHAVDIGLQTDDSILKMFRKGEIGGWKDHLTVAQSELVDQKVKDVLGDTDIKFIYE